MSNEILIPVIIFCGSLIYGTFGFGDALFAIWTGGTTPDVALPRFSEIGIMLPASIDVDRLYGEWQKNADIKILREPYDEVFGRTFLAGDPDGHVIRVCPAD